MAKNVRREGTMLPTTTRHPTSSSSPLPPSRITRTTRVSETWVYYLGKRHDPSELECLFVSAVRKKTKSIEERELSRRVRRASDWLERGEDVIDALHLWNWKNHGAKTDGFGRKNVQIGDEEFKIAKVMGVLPFADRLSQFARRRKNPLKGRERERP